MIPISRWLAVAVTLGGLALPWVNAQVAVRGQTVYTLTGPPITDGVVLIKGSQIETVGSAATTTVPAGYKLLTARVVTPGLIDGHSTVGVSGILNQKQDQDQLDKSAPIQPELRAVDSYNSLDPLVDWVRNLGVTTLHTGHGPGALISGQTLVVKTWPQNLEQALLAPEATFACTLGLDSLSAAKDKAPATIAKSIALLRAELVKAVDYQKKLAKTDPEKRPARDLHLEALVRALEGKQPMLFTVQRHQDILSVLRLAREFGFKVILDGVADAPLVLKEIQESGFPVLLHPTMTRPSADLENASMGTAAKLQSAGILFALQSGYEAYVPKTRVVLFEAALAAANGLTFEQALAAITINPARILGIEDRVGTLAPGKDADLALFDGDPFEYTSHCTGTVVSGVVVSDGVK
jgi:imidazolonepropionase-like amidohydrolase